MLQKFERYHSKLFLPDFSRVINSLLTYSYYILAFEKTVLCTVCSRGSKVLLE